MESRGALSGIRILDFSWLFSGPIATRFMGDHGAEVIKVESSTRPDDARAYAPFRDDIPGANRSALFANYNSNKLGMTLNLNNPQGLDLAKKLVAESDVVIEAFASGTMHRWGLQYEELVNIKPDIIMMSITMQGQSGPFSQYATFGLFFQSLLGFTNCTGWPDRAPAPPPTPYTDFIAPWFAVIGIMGAIDYRRRTGKGQYIDLSQLESSLHFLAPNILEYYINGRDPTRKGNRSDRAAPHGIYRCKGDDKWCAISIFNEYEWNGFCDAIGNPMWTEDNKYRTILSRLENYEELDMLTEQWTVLHSPEEVMALLQAKGVPAGVVQDGRDLVDRDPQLKHRGHFRVLDHPESGSHIYEAPPFRLNKTPAGEPTCAPCLGEHNEYICKHVLGMSDNEFVALVNSGAFG
ncbi:CaiB/BaiF CoA transferase family protein [Chloroflexota bacterium]